MANVFNFGQAQNDNFRRLLLKNNEIFESFGQALLGMLT